MRLVSSQGESVQAAGPLSFVRKVTAEKSQDPPSDSSDS